MVCYVTLCYAYRNYDSVMNNLEEYNRINLLDNMITKNSAK